MVYLVESEENRGEWYRVDLEADKFKGVCTCKDFETRRAPERAGGYGNGECKHLKAVLQAFAHEVLSGIKAYVKKTTGTDQRDVGPP